MPNMSNTSRSIASVPGWTSNSDGTTGSSSGTCTRSRSRSRSRMRQQADDDLEALGVDAVGQVARRLVGEVVDAR